MDAEQIVRALAAGNPVLVGCCVFCDTNEYEPAPTTIEIDGSPTTIARPCSSCGVELWWDAGLWRRL